MSLMRFQGLFLLLFIFPCLQSYGQLVIKFNNRVGTADLATDIEKYQTRDGYPFSISLLQYFVSNFQLTKTNGQVVTIPKKESFFLVKQSIDSSREILLNVPAGDYSAITFLVGIDSLTSTLPLEERKGVLDPGRDLAAGESMYWTWNTGYIFFKMEGGSAAVPADPTGFKQFEFHIGGYGGYNSPTLNNIRKVVIQPGKNKLTVKKDQKAIVSVTFDVLNVFNSKNPIDLKQHHHVMLTPKSSDIADNYARGFSYEKTEYRK
jgi:hypothetical protein